MASRRPPGGLPHDDPSAGLARWPAVGMVAAPGRRAVGLRQVDGMPHRPEVFRGRAPANPQKSTTNDACQRGRTDHVPCCPRSSGQSTAGVYARPTVSILVRAVSGPAQRYVDKVLRSA